jgi:hypothetical protein
MTEIAVNDLPAAINLQMQAGNAVLLLGLPGIGKTQIAQDWLRQHTDQLVVIDGSQTPEELVQGVPFVTTDGGAHLSRELMVQMGEIKEAMGVDGRVVGLNLEELSSFTQDDQRSVMNMVLAGQMPDGTRIDRTRLYVIATANPSAYMDDASDASVNDIENALFTRMAVYTVVPDVESWLAYAEQTDVHPAIIYALTDSPELFSDDAHRTVPRTLTFLSQLLWTADALDVPVTLQDFESLVGEENAGQFKYIYDHLGSLVSLIQVVQEDEAKERFLALSDAEKSYVWLNGLANVPAGFDDQMRELAESLPSDTLLAAFKSDTIWGTNQNLATTRFLAGAWTALQGIE